MPLWDMPSQPNQGQGQPAQSAPTAEPAQEQPQAKILDKGVLEFNGLFYLPGQYDPAKVDTGEDPILPDYKDQGYPTLDEALQALGTEAPQEFEYNQ